MTSWMYHQNYITKIFCNFKNLLWVSLGCTSKRNTVTKERWRRQSDLPHLIDDSSSSLRFLLPRALRKFVFILPFLLTIFLFSFCSQKVFWLAYLYPVPMNYTDEKSSEPQLCKVAHSTMWCGIYNISSYAEVFDEAIIIC